MWGIAPEEMYYHCYSIDLNGKDGRFQGSVVVAEHYGTPVLPLPKPQMNIVGIMTHTDPSDISLINRPMEGTIDVWNTYVGAVLYRLRRTNIKVPKEDAISTLTLEKRCPDCGLPASRGAFVRGALLCREHNFLFGGC